MWYNFEKKVSLIVSSLERHKRDIDNEAFTHHLLRSHQERIAAAEFRDDMKLLEISKLLGLPDMAGLGAGGLPQSGRIFYTRTSGGESINLTRGCDLALCLPGGRNAPCASNFTKVHNALLT